MATEMPTRLPIEGGRDTNSIVSCPSFRIGLFAQSKKHNKRDVRNSAVGLLISHESIVTECCLYRGGSALQPSCAIIKRSLLKQWAFNTHRC